MRRPITSDLPNLRVRLEHEQYARLTALAQENERSVAAEVRVAVKQYLNGKGQAMKRRGTFANTVIELAGMFAFVYLLGMFFIFVIRVTPW